MKKRLYISIPIPITGHDFERQKQRANFMKEAFSVGGKYEVITPSTYAQKEVIP